MRLSNSLLAAYSLPSVPLSMLLTPIIIYLPAFYAGHLGISLSALGIVFFLGRLWDGMTDPIIGYYSDKLRFRMGRRKPWVLVGTPFLIIATYFLCRPPEGVGVVYLLVALVLFYIAYTVVRIPYISWGAELSNNYQERNRIAGFRELGTMLGILISVGAPYFFLSPEEASMDNIMLIFTLTVVILLPIAAGTVAVAVPDKSYHNTMTESFLSGLNMLWRNKPFMRIMLAQGVLYLGTYIYNACMVFLIEQTMGLTGYFLPLILIEYVAMILFVPILISISSKLDKHKIIAFGILVQMGALGLMVFATPGVFWQLAVAFTLVGVSFASWYIIPTSMIADTVDYGKMRGGADSSGIYMAVFNFVDKVALALAALIALPLLEFLGFNPQGGNSASALFSVKLVGVILHIFIIMIAVLIYWKYPINKRKHATVIRYTSRQEKRI